MFIEIIVDGQVINTVTQQELFVLAAEGTIDPETIVRANGKLGRAGQVKGIKFLQPTALPLPTPTSSHTVSPHRQTQGYPPRSTSASATVRSGSPIYWYFEVLKKYAVFSGRARRQEFWMFMLTDAIIRFVLSGFSLIGAAGIVDTLYTLATLLPFLAVHVRRLHDIGNSGWWLCAPLLILFPLGGVILGVVAGTIAPDIGVVLFLFGICSGVFIGGLILFVFFCLDSQPGTNQYGPNPKGVGRSSLHH